MRSPKSITHASRGLALGLLLSAALQAMPVQALGEGTRSAVAVPLDIPSQPLGDALSTFARQSGLQIMFYTALSGGLTAPALKGSYSPDEALTRLLADTALEYQFVDEKTIAIRVRGEKEALAGMAEEGVRVAQVDMEDTGSETAASRDTSASEEGQGTADGDSAATAEEEEEDLERGGIPEILVTGSKVRSLNTDIKRSEDDIQPYVVFNREEIAGSGAANLEEFFRNELTMSANMLVAGQSEVTLTWIATLTEPLTVRRCSRRAGSAKGSVVIGFWRIAAPL